LPRRCGNGSYRSVLQAHRVVDAYHASSYDSCKKTSLSPDLIDETRTDVFKTLARSAFPFGFDHGIPDLNFLAGFQLINIQPGDGDVFAQISRGKGKIGHGLQACEQDLPSGLSISSIPRNSVPSDKLEFIRGSHGTPALFLLEKLGYISIRFVHIFTYAVYEYSTVLFRLFWRIIPWYA
jgi:hypothetical protein